MSHLELFSYQRVETCQSLGADDNGNVNAYEVFNLGEFVCFREHDAAQLTCQGKKADLQNAYIFTVSPGSIRQAELDAIERELIKLIAHESALSSTEQESTTKCSSNQQSQVPEQNFHGTVLDISVDQSGQRSIKFKFSQFLPNDIDPTANGAEKHLIEERLLSQLTSETNIKDLPFSEDYLRVVRKIISMSMGVAVSFDKGDDVLLNDLAYKIELRSELMSKDSIQNSQATDPFYVQLGLVDNDGSCCWSAKWSDFIGYFSRNVNT